MSDKAKAKRRYLKQTKRLQGLVAINKLFGYTEKANYYRTLIRELQYGVMDKCK